MSTNRDENEFFDAEETRVCERTSEMDLFELEEELSAEDFVERCIAYIRARVCALQAGIVAEGVLYTLHERVRDEAMMIHKRRVEAEEKFGKGTNVDPKNLLA